MTIRPGEPWGRRADPPEGAPGAASDAELSRLVAAGALGTGSIVVTGGDLWRTVGGAGDHEFPIDLLRVHIDDAEAGIAAAHVVARDLLGRRWFVAMNGQFWRRYDLGPRSHPNDGLVDVTLANLSWAELVKVARRARTGSHLPHPGLRTERVATGSWDLSSSMHVWIDGVRSMRARHRIAVTVEADASVVAPR